MTTKFLAGAVDLVMVGFEAAVAHYGKAKRVVVTGTPVRPDFFRFTRQEARTQLGLSGTKPMVLSFWGSLGAENMNSHMEDFILRAARENANFHHIHSAGRNFHSMTAHLKAKGLNPGSMPNLDLRDYIYDMPLAMTAADLVLCRAGAATLSELSAIARPAILVPSPNVTADHQTKNAQVLADQGGAILLPETECSGDILYQHVKTLLFDSDQRASMGRVLTAMASPNAAETIYQALCTLL